MSVIVRPDVKGATLAFLQAQAPPLFPGLTASQIKGRLPDPTIPIAGGGTKQMPTFFVSIRKTGQWRADPSLPLSYPRLDLLCYGPTAYDAARLHRTIEAILCPVAQSTRGFTAANCRILDVVVEGGPMENVTPDEGWPMVWFSVSLTASEIPV